MGVKKKSAELRVTVMRRLFNKSDTSMASITREKVMTALDRCEQLIHEVGRADDGVGAQIDCIESSLNGIRNYLSSPAPDLQYLLELVAVNKRKLDSLVQLAEASPGHPMECAADSSPKSEDMQSSSPKSEDMQSSSPRSVDMQSSSPRSVDMQSSSPRSVDMPSERSSSEMSTEDQNQ